MRYEREALWRDLRLCGPLTEVSRLELASEGIARGLARSGRGGVSLEPEPSISRHRASDASAPEDAKTLSDNFLVLHPARPLPFDVSRHAVDPRIVRLEGVLVARLVGAARRDGDDVVLDGRGAGDLGRLGDDDESSALAAALLDTAEGPMLVELLVDTLIVSQASAAEDLSALRAWRPRVEPLGVPLPSPTELLGGRSLEPWLARRVGHLAESPVVLERVASLGTLFRLFVAPTPHQGVGGPHAEIMSRVAHWAASLSAEARARLERDGVHAAGRWIERIDELHQCDDEPLGAEVLQLLYDRDALESLRVVLWTRGRTPSLDRELALADEVALSSASVLPVPPEAERDELLLAVAAHEPLSWWGEVAHAPPDLRPTARRT